MMDYDMMSGAFGTGYSVAAWVTFLLVDVTLVFVIAALWKYISKK